MTLCWAIQADLSRKADLFFPLKLQKIKNPFKQSKHIAVKQFTWVNHDLTTEDTHFMNAFVKYKNCLLYKVSGKAHTVSTAT